MTDRITTEAHDIPWVGDRVASLDRVPGVGTWEVLEHGGCAGIGLLKALTPGDPAPLCPVCDQEVAWQLSHLAPSVAADHRGVGKLP